jgi:hypothetical protein
VLVFDSSKFLELVLRAWTPVIGEAAMLATMKNIIMDLKIFFIFPPKRAVLDNCHQKSTQLWQKTDYSDSIYS